MDYDNLFTSWEDDAPPGMPTTFNKPHLFLESPSAGFDGVFDWAWMEGCFGKNITPMDLDGMVERMGQFIVFETKDVGVEIPKGQQITLNALYDLGVFTVVFVYGKAIPEKVIIRWAKNLGGETTIIKENVVKEGMDRDWETHPNHTGHSR